MFWVKGCVIGVVVKDYQQENIFSNIINPGIYLQFSKISFSRLFVKAYSYCN